MYYFIVFECTKKKSQSIKFEGVYKLFDWYWTCSKFIFYFQSLFFLLSVIAFKHAMFPRGIRTVWGHVPFEILWSSHLGSSALILWHNITNVTAASKIHLLSTIMEKLQKIPSFFPVDVLCWTALGVSDTANDIWDYLRIHHNSDQSKALTQDAYI